MNLVDSSAWLEFFKNSPNARHFSAIIENTEELIVSPINYFEIYKKVLQDFGPDDAKRAIGFLNQGKNIEISNSIALEASELALSHHLHMADSILLATANSVDAIFWTMDAHFKDIPGVKYFEKE